MSDAKTVTLWVSKWHLLTSFCYRFRIRYFCVMFFDKKFLDGSLKPVLAGFYIKMKIEVLDRLSLSPRSLLAIFNGKLAMFTGATRE